MSLSDVPGGGASTTVSLLLPFGRTGPRLPSAQENHACGSFPLFSSPLSFHIMADGPPPYETFYAYMAPKDWALLDRMVWDTMEARWMSFPRWTTEDALLLARQGLQEKALIALARHELYALTINSYSSVANGTTLSSASTDVALFHAFPQENFQHPDFSPFPLLPLSQEYSLHAIQQALQALDSVVSARLNSEDNKANDKERKRLRLFLKEGESAGQEWEGAWDGYSGDKRRLLSRSLWNAFVSALSGGAIPGWREVFFSFGASVYTGEVGEARSFKLPESAESLARLASTAKLSEAAFHNTLASIITHLETHHPHAPSLPHDYGAECLQRFHRLGAMAGLAQAERWRLLVELHLVYHDLSAMARQKMASPAQVFECISKTPTVPAPQPIDLFNTAPPPRFIINLSIPPHLLPLTALGGTTPLRLLQLSAFGPRQDWVRHERNGRRGRQGWRIEGGKSWTEC